MNINKISPIYIVIGLFAIYLILKWTCRLIFGLLDYVILFSIIAAVIWFIKLPKHKKRLLRNQAVSSIKSISRKLGLN